MTRSTKGRLQVVCLVLWEFIQPRRQSLMSLITRSCAGAAKSKQPGEPVERLVRACAFARVCVLSLFYEPRFVVTGGGKGRKVSSCGGGSDCGAQGKELETCGWSYSFGKNVPGTWPVKFLLKSFVWLHSTRLCFPVTGCVTHGRCSYWKGSPELPVRKFKTESKEVSREVPQFFSNCTISRSRGKLFLQREFERVLTGLGERIEGVCSGLGLRDNDKVSSIRDLVSLSA